MADRLRDRINSGPGWYEVINPRDATTCIALVYADGSLYFPEGEQVLDRHEFAFAAARGQAHRLVRADEPAAAIKTAAEREALPVGAVVRSASGTVACRCDPTRGVVFGDDRSFPWEKLALPLTVLWRP